MKYLKLFLLLIAVLNLQLVYAQADRWQQRAEYTMSIDLNTENHQFTGTQELKYTNNSPDDLNRVFYHLFFNAFQPGSMMDIRSQNIKDSDTRVGSRIGMLTNEGMGKLNISTLEMNGAKCKFEHVGTILEVELPKAIAPGKTVVFRMTYTGQVPEQIRRSGRNNAEGIDYSMSQWYPKMSEYDYQGWHANPYVGREYYGIWGDFDVSISLPSNYVVGATGKLVKNDKHSSPTAEGKKTWRFVAKDVHDFVWGADPDYKEVVKKAADGIDMHFYYQENEDTEAWSALPDIMDKAFTYINKNFGVYPYDKYSFIQGGDGGMEYPMATLITGHRSLRSLVGVSVHELMHSWYQSTLGFNESLYPWMDEGFTSYASAEVMNHLAAIGALPGVEPTENPHERTYIGMTNWAKSGAEEALSTHADHYNTNQAYGIGSYVKGSVFLSQLKYIMGADAFNAGMLRFYETWKFKHPNPNDFIRVMEKQSGLELDWYKEYMVNTVKTVDYKFVDFNPGKKKTTVVKLEKVGLFPMPLDVEVTDKKGKKTIYNIPLRIMRGNKPQDDKSAGYEVLEDWPWTNPTYEFVIPQKASKIVSVVIDPKQGMVDIDRSNNRFDNGSVKLKKKK